MAGVFYDCRFCAGSKGCRRNGKNGITCSSHECKLRNQESPLRGQDSWAPSDVMPETKAVNEIEEILGERCCEPHKMTAKRRKNGPGKTANQEFLVRGSFLEDAGENSDDDSDDECPEPNTYWVAKDKLLQDVGKCALKSALLKRQKVVVDGL